MDKRNKTYIQNLNFISCMKGKKSTKLKNVKFGNNYIKFCFINLRNMHREYVIDLKRKKYE